MVLNHGKIELPMVNMYELLKAQFEKETKLILVLCLSSGNDGVPCGVEYHSLVRAGFAECRSRSLFAIKAKAHRQSRRANV